MDTDDNFSKQGAKGLSFKKKGVSLLVGMGLVIAFGVFYMNEDLGAETATMVLSDQLNKIQTTVYPGKYGTWKSWSLRPSDDYIACGVITRNEGAQGMFGDDTGLNGIVLIYCAKNNWVQQKRVTVENGTWGDWTKAEMCKFGTFITESNLQFEVDGGSGGNGIKLRCRAIDGTKVNEVTALKSTNQKHPGTWMGWSTFYPEYFLCGAQVRYVEPNEAYDDSTLNGLKIQLCKEKIPVKNMLKIKELSGRWQLIQTDSNKLERTLTISTTKMTGKELESQERSEYESGLNEKVKVTYKAGSAFEAQGAFGASQNETFSTEVVNTVRSSILQTEKLEIPVSCEYPGQFVKLYQWVVSVYTEPEEKSLFVTSQLYVCTTGYQRGPMCPPNFCQDQNCQKCRL